MKRIALAALAALSMTFLVPAVSPASPASAGTVPARTRALNWAEAHETGHWYCWAGAGPSCYDCSGAVLAGYAHAGIALPHSTYMMLASPRLHRIAAANRQRGDLAFFGTGHVEFVTNRGTFGAEQTGTRVGWHHPSQWWHPTMYFRVY